MPGVIDSLVVELGWDAKGMEAGRRKVEDAFNRTQEGARKTSKTIEESAKDADNYIERLRNNVLGLFAAFTFGRGLKEFVADITSGNASLGRFAKSINESVINIAKWRGAGSLIGATASDIDATFAHLTQQFQQFALTGDSTIVPWMRSLGLSMTDLDGKMIPVGDQLLAIADKVEGMDPAKATTILQNMGISPGGINLILQGRKAIEELLASQQKYAEAVAKDTVAAQRRQRVWNEFRNSVESIGIGLLTILTPALETVTRAAKAFSDWGERHPTLVGAAFSALTGIVVTLSTVMAVRLAGVAVVAVAQGFAGLITIASTLFLRLALLSATALPAVANALLAVGAAIELTPIGWLITAIAAISIAGFLLVKNWDSIRRWWKGLWGDMSDDASAGSSNIQNSLGGGSSGGSATDQALNLIKGFEGFQGDAKWDVNAYRGGYGSDTVTDPNTGAVSKVQPGQRISRGEAEADLRRRVGSEFLPKAVSAIGQAAWDRLPDATKAAILSVTYNYGSTPSSVVRAAQTGDPGAVASAIRGLSGHNGGINARRRGQEAAIAAGGAQGGASAARTASYARPRGGGSDNRRISSAETHIGSVTINTRATDARGIARDFTGAVQAEQNANQANFGQS